MAKRDYYDILGIPKTASEDELRKAYRALVRKFHPDVNRSNPKAEEKFKEVQEAYDVLSDATKRRNYDQFGHVGVNAPPGGEAYEQFRRGQQPGGSRAHTWRSGPGVTVEDFDTGGAGPVGGDPFADLFEQMFGGRGGAGKRGAKIHPQAPLERGADVEYPVTLTFEQAARGTTLPLQIRRGGQLETIDVKIPPGVKDGSRIRIKGRGEHANGEPGDLYIITQVRAHPYFRREGLDISIDLPLSLYEAMTGTKVEVPTLDGPVTLTIPPGTSSGAKLRIKGRGIERASEKGDEFVIIKVMVPKDLDDEDRALLDKLAAKHPINARADVKW